MKEKMKHYAGLLGFALLLAVGWASATDSTFHWSDDAGARGTLYYSDIVISNSTIAGATISGATSINATNITAGNLAEARVTNVLRTSTVKLGAFNLASCTNYAVENLVGTALPAVSGASLTSLTGANLTGNLAYQRMTNAFATTIQPAYASGYFSVVDTTQLVFIAGVVTNVIDADIAH